MKKAYFQYYETFEKVLEKIKNIEEREHMRKTSSLACNGELDISGDTGAVIRLCARIYAAEAQKYEGGK